MQSILLNITLCPIVAFGSLGIMVAFFPRLFLLKIIVGFLSHFTRFMTELPEKICTIVHYWFVIIIKISGCFIIIFGEKVGKLSCRENSSLSWKDEKGNLYPFWHSSPQSWYTCPCLRVHVRGRTRARAWSRAWRARDYRSSCNPCPQVSQEIAAVYLLGDQYRTNTCNNINIHHTITLT